MVDLWPDEEGLIDPQAHTIGFMYAADSCTEGKPVKLATGTTGYVKCQDGTALGDAFLVALKAADQYDYLPVATYGVIKLNVDGLNQAGAISTGEFVINSATYVIAASSGGDISATLKLFGGSSYILGCALQPSATASDDILVLLGMHI